MKKLYTLLIFALLFSFISCDKSLKNNAYISSSGYSTADWNGLIDPNKEYAIIRFVDEYNAVFSKFSDATNTMIESYNINYNYNKSNKSGSLTLSGNNRFAFKIYNNKPKRMMLFLTDSSTDFGVALYKVK